MSDSKVPFIKRKTSIILSFLIILVCLANIVGLTEALFFDNGSDGTICTNITTGQVKVDIIDLEQNSLEGDALRFMKKDSQTPLYFEPGAAYCTQGFQIKNGGNVVINYHMYISNNPAVDMVAFQEAFDFFITDDLEGFRTVEKLTDFYGTLQPRATSKTYFLIVKMKDSASNEFQNQCYDGIGITVYAVQGNVDARE